MDTPPPPTLSTNKSQTHTSKKPPERTAKTPFQSSSSIYQRSFRSDLQPNKSYSRYPTSVRYHPFTSQRQAHRPPGTIDGKSANNNEPKSHLVSRLGNLIKNKEVPKKLDDEPPKQSEPPKFVDVKRDNQLLPSITPGTSFRHQLKINHPQPHHLSTAVTPGTSLGQQLKTTHLQPHHLSTAITPGISLRQQIKTTDLQNNQLLSAITPGTSSRQQQVKVSNFQYQPLRVNDKTYQVLRKIGSGGSAKVYEGYEPSTAQTVAIKRIFLASADQQTQDSYFNEKALLAKLRDSQHVVRMYDSEYKAESKELLIVMEKGDTDLSQVIYSYFESKDKLIDGLFIKFYWRGLLQAVNDIHQHGIVHADLKPVNFILSKNQIKLIDFGIASAVEPDSTSVIKDYQMGTINYMAPESLRNRAFDASFQYLRQNDVDENSHPQKIIKYNSKVDIWSLGCILYSLVYGRPPFDNIKEIQSKVLAITNPNHIINFPKISNEKLLNCIKSCLRYNPSERPSAQELLNDPYLKEDVVTLQK